MKKVKNTISVLFTIVATYCAFSQTTSSIADGNWTSNGNWDGGSPSDASTANVNTNINLNTDVTCTGNYTVNGTLVDAAGGSSYALTVKNSGTILADGTTTFEGDLTVENTASLAISGCETMTVGSATIKNNTTVSIASCGDLIIIGDLILENLTGIACDGTLTVTGNVIAKNNAAITGSGTLTSGGSVEFENTATIFGSSTDCIPGPCSFGASLPVDLLSFTSSLTDNHEVLISWITFSEINNDFFTIEKSTNAMAFETVAELAGAGNSRDKIEYNYIDKSPKQGINYYRLKQTDFDGNFKILKTVAVPFDFVEENNCSLSVYPNPCFGSCTFRLEDCFTANDNDFKVEVYDAIGREIEIILPNGNDISLGSVNFNTENNLDPGMYIIRASSSVKSYSQLMIVK